MKGGGEKSRGAWKPPAGSGAAGSGAGKRLDIPSGPTNLARRFAPNNSAGAAVDVKGKPLHPKRKPKAKGKRK